jgi:hypothetical protein
MSWDIYIQDLPDVPSPNDIPENFRPAPLGAREALVAKILEAVPQAERQGSDWIFLKLPDADLSIQAHMEDSTLVRYFLVHVHGGDASPTWVARIVRSLGFRALDTSIGGWFDPARPDAGYHKWLAEKGG